MTDKNKESRFTMASVNGQAKRGPNLEFIPQAPNERLGTLAAISEREAKATMFRKMGHASARLMADNRPYTWGEIGTGRHVPKKTPAQRAAYEKAATKKAKKKR